MTTKGERTRADIVRRSAALMNRHGFLTAPVSALIEATGIQKGGLYRHFESRDALAADAFEHAVGEVRQRLVDAMAGTTDACDRLLAMLAVYEDAGIDAPLPGGCPIMNTAIESDHAHPGMKQRAQAAMAGWHGLLVRVVEAGRRAGQIRAEAVAADVATTFIACIEGGVMMTQLYGDPAYLAAARRHLTDYIERELRAHAGGRS